MSTIPTCAVLCVVRDSEGGEPILGAKVTATLSGFEVDSGYVAPHKVSTTTDANGECTLDLWPNQLGAVESFYTVKIEALGKSLTVEAVIPNTTTCNLWEVATLPPYDGLDTGTFILTQVLAAAAAAAVSATAAAGSATTAAADAATASAQATIATTGATTATTKATEAVASANLAQAWAVQLGTPVSGAEYSAKYHALAAAASAASIADGPVYSWVGLFGTITLVQARTALSITNVDNTSDANKPVSGPQLTALNLKVNTSTYTAGMALKADLVGGTVPANQLPSYVDDVLEFANLAAFPAVGETGKIYIAIDSNKTYRWSGSVYIEISPSPGSTDSVTEGATNLYFTETRVRATVLTGISLLTNAAITAADSVLSAFGKLQKQITDLIATVALKSNITTTVTKDSGTGAAAMPSGTSAQRPANAAGLLRYSRTLSRWEGNNGTAWGSLGGASGGGNDSIFYESDAIMTADYTVTTGRNAVVPGPLTIAAGATLTIPAGSVVTIV